MISYLNTVNLE